jgi:hypothetical protein
LRIWGSRSVARIEIRLGYGLDSLIRCLNTLILQDVCIRELHRNDRQTSSIVPIAIQVTMRHPGRKKLEDLIVELDRISYGCHEITTEGH